MSPPTILNNTHQDLFSSPDNSPPVALKEEMLGDQKTSIDKTLNDLGMEEGNVITYDEEEMMANDKDYDPFKYYDANELYDYLLYIENYNPEDYDEPPISDNDYYRGYLENEAWEDIKFFSS